MATLEVMSETSKHHRAGRHHRSAATRTALKSAGNNDRYRPCAVLLLERPVLGAGRADHVVRGPAIAARQTFRSNFRQVRTLRSGLYGLGGRDEPVDRRANCPRGRRDLRKAEVL